MYSVSRKNCENSAAATRSCVAFDAASVRSRKSRIGSSGAFERSSITKNATISAADAASSPIVEPSPQPCLRGAGQRVHEQHQPARDRGRAGDVEMPVVELGPALAQQPRADREEQRCRPGC